MYINNEPLLQKEVDWSLLNDGITLPIRLNNIFGQMLDGSMLNRGENKEIRIFLDGRIYYAKITNVNFLNNKRKNDTLQLRYVKNSDLANKLRSLYKTSYEHFLKERGMKKKGNSLIKLPEDKKEYINIYNTEYLDIYYFNPTFAKDFNESNVMGGNQMDISIELLKDIKKFINDIDNNQYKKDRWTRYIVAFHDAWQKSNKGAPLIIGEKYIWGNRVVISPNKKIADVFNESIDNNTVKFFKKNHKKYIEEIEEKDLIQLMYQSNFGFIRFKRIIDKLFTKNGDGLSNNITYNEKVQEIHIDEDNIVNLENKDTGTIRLKANDSIKNIMNQLNIFEDIINYYNAAILELNNKINFKNEEIKKLKNIIDSLQKELEESRTAFNELENIKKTLGGIKDLLKKDSLL